MLRIWHLVAATFFPMLVAVAAAAQQSSPLQGRPPPGTVAGVVVDTAGRAIDSATVLLGATRAVVSAANGAFRFDGVRPGRYDIVARRIGLLPQRQSVVVRDSGVFVRFALSRLPQSLPPAITTATRIGLVGVVADTAHRALTGATVDAIGVRRRVQTDSLGGFFLELDPGSYMIRFARAGYADQLVGVRISQQEGRRVVIWMSPASRGLSNRLAAGLFDMNRRIDGRRKSTSRLFTAEEIASIPVNDLERLATIGGGQLVDDRCLAVIDGGPLKAPLWSFNPNEVAFLEVYGSIGVGRPRDCPTSVYVWLKK